MEDELLLIQRLQFADRPAAEKQLAGWLSRTGTSGIAKVQLNPKPESLNSLNGFATFDDGQTVFFKAHTEENEVLTEYYNQDLIQKAGYPVLSTKMLRTRPGQQIAFYEVIDLPTLFDIVKEEEDIYLEQQKLTERAAAISEAQEQLDRKIFQIYCDTFTEIDAEKNAAAPIQQLFAHRLADDGRISLFYSGKSVDLGAERISFDELSSFRWNINGVQYGQTLAELISDAGDRLNSSVPCLAVTGHGDAHNGNVFYQEDSAELYYFDPAFAGVHSPFLDIVKPLFHNVFTRWMYFPKQVESEITIEYAIKDRTIYVNHSFALSPIRLAFLQSKLDYVLAPLVELLGSQGKLDPDWRQLIRSAMLCCPLLTVNLAADFDPKGKLAETYPPAIKLLGLCMAIEAGAETVVGNSSIRDCFESIFSIGEQRS